MKTYKLFAIGARSSGKTCFLAAFYKQLSVATQETGFSLMPLERSKPSWVSRYSATKHNRLIGIYNQIESSGDWPSGTTTLEDWEFKCLVQAKDDNKYDVLKLVYYDYRGDILTRDPGDDISVKEELEETERKLASSDAILFFLDGHKLLAFMQDDKNSLPSSLNDDLNHLLPRLQKVGSKPVQFIITKWDLFEGKQGKKYSLGEVKNRLLENKQFAALVEFQNASSRRTRLIPVSAVGKGFATIGENQVMKKASNVKAEPYQVEMTLACMLIDGFDSAYKNLYPWQKRVLDNTLLASGKLSQVSFLIAAATVLSLPVEPQYKMMYVPALAVIFKWGGDELEKIVTKIRETKSYNIKNKDEATLKVIERCKSLTEDLVKNHPSSLLT